MTEKATAADADIREEAANTDTVTNEAWAWGAAVALEDFIEAEEEDEEEDDEEEDDGANMITAAFAAVATVAAVAF